MMFVLTFPLLAAVHSVDSRCAWDNWGAWRQCQKNCIQVRNRECWVVGKLVKCNTCVGNSQQKQACKTTQWTDWKVTPCRQKQKVGRRTCKWQKPCVGKGRPRCNGMRKQTRRWPCYCNPKCIKKFGCAGGPGGFHFDDANVFYKLCGRVKRITIRHGNNINCMGFTWKAGTSQEIGKCHGGQGGVETVIILAYDERIVGFKGWTKWPLGILELTILTNKKEYGPYGNKDGHEFTMIPGNKQYEVVYLSGKSSTYLDQMCIYYRAC